MPYFYANFLRRAWDTFEQNDFRVKGLGYIVNLAPGLVTSECRFPSLPRPRPFLSRGLVKARWLRLTPQYSFSTTVPCRLRRLYAFTFHGSLCIIRRRVRDPT